MTKLLFAYSLPFVSVTIQTKGKVATISNVLLDTGSYATLFDTDVLADYGIAPEGRDRIRNVIGIGGEEWVVETRVESLGVGEIIASPFRIQTGALNYRFQMNGILGVDFLVQAGAVVDFRNHEIRKG